MSPGALRRQIGQLLIAGFNGQQIPAELRSLAREFGLGGVILFARNIAVPEQVAELAFDAARLVPDLPVWVSVDQEGGRVARLKSPFTEWPPMATLGRSGDVALAERFARALAMELKSVGVTLDYAPVLDIHTNPRNSVIGDRALAEKAETVAIMTAHVFVPSLDEKRPATLSSRVVTDLLRHELQYDGVILSDDLEMKAIAAEYAVPAAAVLAIEAGCDGVLICSGDHDTQAAALEALVRAVEGEQLRRSRVEDALQRHQRAKERFLASPVSVRPLTGRALRAAIGREEHHAIAEEMARFL